MSYDPSQAPQCASGDPIFALATNPRGPAALAILRLSGKDCHKLLRPLLRFRSDHKRAPGRLYLAQLTDQDQVIDQPMVCFFHSPKSYTGEDAAEIHLHGSPYIVRQTQEVLRRSGFRSAEPGEFTKRAFLNGKLSLSESEALHELISSESEQQWLAAKHLASGKLAEKINDIRKTLLQAMALLEAQIDFPEEDDVASVNRTQAQDKVTALKEQLADLSSSFRSGRVAAQGLRVALVGPPNSGKSSLLNALLDQDRAIVSDIAGTTRDYLEESCLIDGRLIRLVDTAGIRKSEDPIERMGVERSLQMIGQADLVVFLLGADQTIEDLSQDYLDIKSKSDFFVCSKSDLVREGHQQDFDFKISTKLDTGLDEFKRALTKSVDQHTDFVRSRSVFVSTPRHAHAISSATEYLQKFLDESAKNSYEECLAFELQEANRKLDAITGTISPDEILGEIFSSFCIGK